MRIAVGIFFLLSSLAQAETTPTTSAARSGDRRPWQVSVHGGFYTQSADQDVQSDWDYKLAESYLVTTRLVRTVGKPFVHFVGGLEARYGRTVSELGSSKIIVEISRLDFLMGIGSEPAGLNGFGGYIDIGIKLLGSKESTFHGNGFSRTLQEDSSGNSLGIMAGLTGFYRITPAVRVSLTLESDDSAVTTGIIYAF